MIVVASTSACCDLVATIFSKAESTKETSPELQESSETYYPKSMFERCKNLFLMIEVFKVPVFKMTNSQQSCRFQF